MNFTTEEGRTFFRLHWHGYIPQLEQTQYLPILFLVVHRAAVGRHILLHESYLTFFGNV